MANFKDTRGVWATLSLFADRAGAYKDSIVFESVDEARKLFIATKDPTGITFADEYLGGYEHWKALLNCRSLELEMASWKEEMEVRLRSEGLKNIHAMAKESFQASKLIMEGKWDDRKAGRPSKAEVEKNIRVESKMKQEFNKDIARIKR